MSETGSLFPVTELREYAAALDKDRGHDRSRVTTVMREAAIEIERLRELLDMHRAEFLAECRRQGVVGEDCLADFENETVPS